MSLHLYSDNTPNGWKIEIMLEELQLPYTYHRIDISKGQQFQPEFLKISPNNKIPAILDEDGPSQKPLALFESGAILMYLAEKTQSLLFPQQTQEKYQTISWLMFQMGGIGPFLGQVYHFTNSAPEKIPYAIQRYSKEADRLFSVMDKRLQSNSYLAGEQYTIADIACFPWILSHNHDHGALKNYTNLQRWFQRLEKRRAIATVLQKIANSG